LAQARHRVEVDLHALEVVDLTRLADFRLHREDSRQHFADRRRIRDRGEQDAALFHAARVRSFVVDELSLHRAVDGAEFEPALAQREIRVQLNEGADGSGARQECSGFAEVLVARLQLDEMLRARVHAGRAREMDKKVALDRPREQMRLMPNSYLYTEVETPPRFDGRPPPMRRP